jgi:hypothetical protein
MKRERIADISTFAEIIFLIHHFLERVTVMDDCAKMSVGISDDLSASRNGNRLLLLLSQKLLQTASSSITGQLASLAT